MMDKITGLPCTGPHKILDVSNDGSAPIMLDLQEAFQGTKPRWVNVANVKPLVYTPSGRLFVAMPPDVMDEIQDAKWSNALVYHH